MYLSKEVLDSLESDQVSQFAEIIGGLIGSVLGFMVKAKD
jgi:hypothetical protein